MTTPRDELYGLSVERARSFLSYDPLTGEFRWAETKANKIAGEIAGCISQAGYVLIGMDGRTYRGHRLAWFYTYGVWPPSQIDHKNMVKSDNRLENLRLATSGQNKGNRRKDPRNTSGFKGVCWDRERQCWSAFIKVNGKSIFLGRYPTREGAWLSYQRAAETHFGEFARAG